MKGLFVKDLLIIKSQWKSLIMFFIVGVIMSLSFEPTAVITYLVVISSMVAMGTIGYDEIDNGFCFLFTLPATRKDYVREKYLFCILWSAACAVIGTLLCLAMVRFNMGGGGAMQDFSITETIVVMGTTVLLLYAIMLPLRIKYGSEKSRLVLYLFFGVVAVVIFLAAKLPAAADLRAKFLAMAAQGGSGVGIAVAVFVFAAVCFVISFVAAERIIMKKEF